MCVAFAYTDGNGNRNGNCDANAYSNDDAQGYANTQGCANTTAASHTGASAVSRKRLYATFFGDSRSNSRVPEKPRVLYLRARQGKDKGWNGHRGDS